MIRISMFAIGCLLVFFNQSVAVTYQGELSQAAQPYTGTVDLTFSLYDAVLGGNQVGVTDLHTDVEVSNGRFVVQLEQWAGEFDGSDFWLEITAAVPAGSATFVTLNPRQKISPVPYAAYAYDLDVTGLQMRVSEECNGESAIQVIDINGGVVCGEFAAADHSHDFAELTNIPADLADGDDDTVYSGADFALSSQNCAVGQTVTGIAANGTITCATPPMANTPPDCNQQNQALQYSSLNGWSCVDISTIGPSAGGAQGYEVTDSWGNTWDGDERAALPWAEASQVCTGVGGRLPSITELYRVSGDFKGDVGSPYETNHLWSQTWWNKSNKTQVRLNDGAISHSIATNSAPFRCIWPAANMSFFAGNNCMGEPGDGCWNHAGYASQKMFMDKMERPPVSYVAATDECAFVHAHLAGQQDYAENVINGLPNGSNEWQWTSNHARYDMNTLVRWDGVDVNYTDFDAPYVTWASRSNGVYGFRCVGVNQNTGPYPSTVANEFIATTTQIKAIDAATTTATYGDSINGCFNQGGHMAHSRDIMELVRAGLTSGTGPADYLWMSDHSRYDLNQIARWTGVDTAYNSHYSEYVSWATIDATNAYQHRCVFYPIDDQYNHPPDSSCSGGFSCATFNHGDSQMAVDLVDRSVATYLAATQTCISVGGRLPTTLQMTELIRAGLVNGTNDWLWTSDSAGNDANSNSYAMKVRWNGVEANFSPIYSGSATWDSKGATENAFRCVWSNELR